MKKHRTATHDHEEVTEHAKALVAATGHIAEEKVAQARQKLSDLLAQARESYELIEEKAKEGARQTDLFIREKPYHAVGLAAGIGILIGFCLAKRK